MTCRTITTATAFLLLAAAPAFSTQILPGQTLPIETSSTLINPFTPGAAVDILQHSETTVSGGLLRAAVYQNPDGRYVYAYQFIQLLGAEQSPPLNDFYYVPPATADATLYLPLDAAYSADLFVPTLPGQAADAPSPTATRTDSSLSFSGFGNVALSTVGLYSQPLFLLSNDAPIQRTIAFSPDGIEGQRAAFSAIAPGPVPEPASLALLPLAMIALATRFRRMTA